MKHILLLMLLLPLLVWSQDRPNIIVFIADDMSMDIGAYGNKGVQTPHLDELARKGLILNNAFLTTPQCSPSRASLLSGQFAHTIGVEDLHIAVPDSVRILPYFLSRTGYKTGIVLKSHIGNSATGQFDWNDKGFYPDWVQGKWNAKATDNFRSFLDFAKKDPFFLWVGFVDAHRPYGDSLNKAPEVHDPSDVIVPPYLIDNGATRKDLAHYYDEIARMDAHIGNMIRELTDRGELENTIIMFISDNGMPFPRAKGTVYDSGIQTPWIISWPGHIEEGTTYDGLVSLIDLAPTILDLAGAPIPEEMYGQSIQPVFYDQQLAGREYIFAERNWHEADEHIRALRTNRYKLIINSYVELPHGSPSDVGTSPSWYALKEGQRLQTLTRAQAALFDAPRSAVELYDIVIDPFETNNLVGEPESLQVIDELIKVMDDWQKESNDHPPYVRRRKDIVDRVNGVRTSRERAGYYGEESSGNKSGH